MQPIRTASEIHAKIIIKPLERIPLYQKLAQKVKELHLLGMTYKEIAKSLGVSKNTIKKACNHLRGGTTEKEAKNNKSFSTVSE